MLKWFLGNSKVKRYGAIYTTMAMSAFVFGFGIKVLIVNQTLPNILDGIFTIIVSIILLMITLQRLKQTLRDKVLNYSNKGIYKSP